MATKIKKKYRTMKIDKPEKEYEYRVPLKTSKERDRCIKRIERIVRSSLEYRDYIQYLKTYVDMTSCAFFSNINNSGAENKKIKIEIHHEPFTLYDYADVVLSKYLQEGLPINEMLMADEVMMLHYQNTVGLIPLSKTIHQMIHKSNKVKIPLYLIYGNYSKFLSEYSEYISDDLTAKLERKINETKALNDMSYDDLECQFTYIETEGVETAQKMDDGKEELSTSVA